MPPSWRQRYGQKTMTDMEKLRRAVACTGRDEAGIPEQSWSGKVRQMDSILETIVCRVSGDELLETDCQMGGKWELHVEDEYRQNTAGVYPAEVIRPGHTLQIEIAKYFRGQLHEDYPPVFDDDSEDTDVEGEAGSNFPSSDKDSGAEANDQAPFDAPETLSNARQLKGDTFQHGSPSSSSSEACVVADDLDAEQDRLAAVFADFPTCINMTKHLSGIDDEHYGLLAIIQDAAWSQISGESLTARVRQWIADFTINNAIVRNGNHSENMATSDSHIWLFATPGYEFICNTVTLHVWYRRRPAKQH
ncbi:hypothetical protein N0V93_003858 [Gnomoniopsis smithogilvyi]|uniref:Uncharacterized protein n=1 Tax=Gnomoniopsis smithogilvyi TaxID=1191159 RepID=A0A9W8YXF9_9PEZI|nr:hypothetical protein N0V93_003858 [Gnomoniopsis smithogilvyi]